MKRSVSLFAVSALTVFGAAQAAEPQSPVVLSGVDPTLAAVLRALLPARAPPRSAFEAERLAEEAARLLYARLREDGYYGAQVTPLASAAGTKAEVLVQPGALFRIGAVDTDFSDAAPDPVAMEVARRAAGALPVGGEAKAADVLAAETGVLQALRAAGFADASMGERDVVVDHAAKDMRVRFRISAGQAVRLGAVQAPPAAVLDPNLTVAIAGLATGRLYAPEPLQSLRRDLLATGAFRRVEVGLADRPGADGLRDVLVAVEPARPRVVEIGAGWSTSEGLGVEGAWTMRNATRQADAIVVSGSLSEQQQRLGVQWRLPFGGGRDRSWVLDAAGTRDISGPFERIGVRVAAAQEARARRELGVSIGATVSADVFTRSEGVEQALVGSGHVELRRDDTDDPLDAREGAILEIRLEPSLSAGDGAAGFVRSFAQARGYFSSDGDDDPWTVAARVKLGWVESLFGQENDIPPDRRFYAGGGGSVRGYAFNSLRVERNSSQPPGGRGVFETGLEVRARFDETLGAVVFLDGGAPFDVAGDLSKVRWGAGVGVRYDLGFGPLRLDIATPLDRRGGDAPISAYVSIGQAF